jgi:ABC-2 type transport system permease protein
MISHRAWVIARTDLRQLAQSRDFWLPMLILASLFFVIIPGLLLLMLTRIGSVETAAKLGDVVDTIGGEVSRSAKAASPDPNIQAAYALAVYLVAPLAIVIPLTVASAVGSTTIIGERERGTGEFLAHSPVSETDVFVGKLMASLIPGYLTAIIGFGTYSLVVNVLVGPKVGGWFFPTATWWIFFFAVLPPFICLGIALILNISARVSSSAAAQQASSLVTLPLILITYSVTTSSLSRSAPTSIIVGTIAWGIAIIALMRGTSAVRRERLLGLGS